MADIQLPGKNLISGYQTGTPGSMGAAAAPWQAAGAVGREVQQLGEKGMDFVVKMQRVKNVQMANDLEIAANEEYAAFQNDILTNPNPAEWPGLWQKRLDGLKKSHLPDGLAPEQKALLGERFAQFSSRTTMDITRDAAVNQVGQARKSISNRIDQAIRLGDYDGAVAAANDGRAAGLYDDPDHERIITDIGRKNEVAELEQLAQSDPEAAKKLIDEKNEDGTYKHSTHLEPADRNRLKNFADGAKRDIAYDTVERFNNGRLDGTITRPEQVEKLFPTASATLKLRMIEELKRDVTDAEREMMKTPEYQQAVKGKVSAMLDGYSANLGDFDERYYEMDTMIRTLPEGEMKARLNFRLDKVRKDQVEAWEDSADEYRDRFKDAYRGGVFGLGVSRKPVQELIADGILNDKSKLLARGFSEEQAAMIISSKADEGDLKALGVSEAKAKALASGHGIGNQIMLLRELDGRRQGFEAQDSDPYVRQAFDIIASGKAGFVDWPDPKANQEAERKYGAALDEFEKWYRVNKDAKPEAIEKKFYGILKPEGEKAFRDLILDPGPNEAVDSLLPPR